ncbi:MAG: hypothetical protein ABJL67_10655, partial [Sulfitobacter sp.]
PIWGLTQAVEVGIVSKSRNILAKIMAGIVCGSFGLTVSEGKTETMCLMTKHVGNVNAETACQVYEQSTRYVYYAATVCENANRNDQINRRVLLADLRFRRYNFPLYDQPIALLQLQVRMLKAGVVGTMLSGLWLWRMTCVPGRI